MLERPAARKTRASSESERGAGRVARNRLRIAWMYYVEGLTQNEIADKLGIGRVTVVRNINEALKQREVKIWIEGEIAECFQLEEQLKQAFGLREAVVVPEPSNPALVTKSIGVAAGMYITDSLTDDMSIGANLKMCRLFRFLAASFRQGATIHRNLLGSLPVSLVLIAICLQHPPLLIRLKPKKPSLSAVV